MMTMTRFHLYLITGLIALGMGCVVGRAMVGMAGTDPRPIDRQPAVHDGLVVPLPRSRPAAVTRPLPSSVKSWGEPSSAPSPGRSPAQPSALPAGHDVGRPVWAEYWQDLPPVHESRTGQPIVFNLPVTHLYELPAPTTPPADSHALDKINRPLER